MYKRFLLRNNHFLIIGGALILLVFIASCHSHKKSTYSFDITKNNTLLSKNDSSFRKVILLSSGNVIILNARSKLYKPVNSQKPTHDFSLDGDAFFEIFPSKDTRITVHTGMYHLITSGSFFRVYAHQQNPGQTVKVLRGELIAEKAYPSDFPDTEILHAGDMVMINNEIDLMEKEVFDTTDLAAWFHGNIVFNNTPFNSAMRKLEDWYDVEIEINGHDLNLDDSSYNITASYHDLGLNAVLDSLSLQKKFHYTIEKDRTEISF
jgi:ferric-dicitrate binding protein FerR (iron transport regulator)